MLLSPDEVSISDLASAKEIHRIGGNFLKAPWYGKFSQEDFEEVDKGIFSMREPKIHANRRKLFANAFSKNAIVEWEDVIQQKVAMTMAGIRRDVQNKGQANVLNWFTFMVRSFAVSRHARSVTTEAALYRQMMLSPRYRLASLLLVWRKEKSVLFTIIILYTSGRLTFFSCVPQKTQFIKDLESVMMLSGISVELPWLRPIFTLLQPNERLAVAARAAIAETRREGYASGGGGKTTIFAKMLAAGDANALTLPQIEREASNLVVAGSDTTAVTLTYLVYAVLSSPHGIRERLSEELSHLEPGFSPQEAAGLPFLSLVIQETLRLYGAAPGESDKSLVSRVFEH